MDLSLIFSVYNSFASEQLSELGCEGRRRGGLHEWHAVAPACMRHQRACQLTPHAHTRSANMRRRGETGVAPCDNDHTGRRSTRGHAHALGRVVPMLACVLELAMGQQPTANPTTAPTSAFFTSSPTISDSACGTAASDTQCMVSRFVGAQARHTTHTPPLHPCIDWPRTKRTTKVRGKRSTRSTVMATAAL